MTVYNAYFFPIIYLFVFFIRIQAASQSYRFERQIGSTIVLPPCLTTLPTSSSTDDVTTILFKADSGELLSMNGKLVSNNPRLMIKSLHSFELMIKSIELSDEGQYECRTDEIINYILHLMVVNSSTVHLNVLEGSNVTLQCTEDGMWIIEESHRGGPVRTQYTTELVLNNLQRNDNRYHKIICSTLNGHHKREYIIDIMYKPAVKVMMSIRRRLMCIICAHPLPHRIHWWWNTRKERDDNIHQTNINQSCIAQQFTFVLEKEYDTEQTIICEAENKHGKGRGILKFGNKNSATNAIKYMVPKSLINTESERMTTAKLSITSASSVCYRTSQFIVSALLSYTFIFY